MEGQVGPKYIRPAETGWIRVHQSIRNRVDHSTSDHRKQVGSEYISPSETGFIIIHQSSGNWLDQSTSVYQKQG